MSAISFLAGMGAGAVRSERVEREMAIRDQEEARRQALFNEAQAARAKAAADEAELRSAAAPMPVTETQIPGPVMPGEAPLPTAPTVGNRQFAERGVAEATAAASNDPKAVRERIMSTLTKQGRVIDADKVRSSGLQGDAAELQLKKFTEDAIKEGTMDFLGTAMAGASPEEVKAAFNKNGKNKLKDVTVEPYEFDHPSLGKQRSARIKGTLEDGTQVDIPDAFQASFALFGAAKRFDLLQSLAKEKRQAEKDDRQLDIQQQNADTQEKYRRDQAENMRQQRNLQAEQIKLAGQAAAAAASGGGAGGAGAAIAWDKDADTFVKDRFTSKNQETGKQEVDAPAIQFVKTLALAESSRNGGDTTRAAAKAMEVNDRMVAKSGGDPAKLHTLRMDMLQSLQPRPPASPADGISKPVIGAGPAPQLFGASVGPTSAPPRATPAALAATAPVAPQIQPQHAAALEPLNAAVAQAASALAMAARSGDQRAIALYGQQIEAARAARMQEAVRRLGQAGAQAYLSSLPQ